MSCIEAIISYVTICYPIFLEGLREVVVIIFNTYLPHVCELHLYCYVNQHVNLYLSVYVKKL
jgi:hypothetical protein